MNLPPTGAFVFTTAAGLPGNLKKFPAAAAVANLERPDGRDPHQQIHERGNCSQANLAELQKLGEPVAEPGTKADPLDDLGRTLKTDAPKAIYGLG